MKGEWVVRLISAPTRCKKSMPRMPELQRFKGLTTNVCVKFMCSLLPFKPKVTLFLSYIQLRASYTASLYITWLHLGFTYLGLNQ